MNFCPKTKMLLEDVTNGDALMFKASKTGNMYAAKPEHTMLASENMGDLQNASKFKNALHNLAFDRINARTEIDGCEKCGRKIVSYTRLGAEKRIFYACVCGHHW